MSKDKKAAPSKNSPSAKAEAAASFKYGVEAVAEATGRKATSVRVAFRKHGVAKAEGGVYGWNKEADMKAAIAQAFPTKAKVEKKAEKAPAKAAIKSVKKAKSTADEASAD